MPASRWEKIKGKKIPSSLELDPIIQAFLGKKNEILDIGCGPGKVSLQLASLGHLVRGIDLNREGIEIAKTAAKEAGLEESLEFRVGDASSLPYASEKFDLALMQAFLTTVPGPEAREEAVREAFRVLKPGGRLYISEFGQSWHLELYRKRYLRDFPVTGEEGSFLARDPETGKPEFVAHHFSEKELVFLLLKNGFSLDSFRAKGVLTRTGNRVNGFVAIGKKDQGKKA